MSSPVPEVVSTGKPKLLDRVRQLRFKIDAAIGIGGKILDRVRKDFVVADYRQHVVRRVERGDKKSDFLHRTGNTAHRYEIADLERPEHNHECAGGEIRQQAAPRHADGDAGGSQDRGKTGRLDAEVTENRDDQNDIQSDRDNRADIAPASDRPFGVRGRRTPSEWQN